MVEVKGVADAEDRARKLIGERHPKVRAHAHLDYQSRLGIFFQPFSPSLGEERWNSVPDLEIIVAFCG